MITNSSDLSILVLSCDDYADLWDDFFSFKERYWPDCPYPTYLVTDTLDYTRDGVRVLKAGPGVKWSTRVRRALEKIETPFVCPVLDDHFIIRRVDTSHFAELLSLAKTDNVSYLAFERRAFIQPEKEWEYYKNDLVVIPKHLKYGINTSGAIWNKDEYYKLIGPEDYSPWKFEINMCELAKTEAGLPGLLLFDAGLTLNLCEKEIVRQGVFMPNALKYVKKVTGVDIDTSRRGTMSQWGLLVDRLRAWASGLKYGRTFIRKTMKFFGFKFFTEE